MSTEAHIFVIKTIKICGQDVVLKDNDARADEFDVRDDDVLDVVIDIADPEDPESITVRAIQRRDPWKR